MSPDFPGPIVLLSSGETLPSSGSVHEFVAQRLPERPRIVILETPAGFQPNSDIVAGKIKKYLAKRLQNYNPTIDVLPARRRGTEFSTDEEEVVAPILKADEILMGPGSPTYTVRQLHNSLAFQMIAARQCQGATLVLSSAATLAFGAYTLPVYEIYKVGEDLHWKDGLDYFKAYGLSLSIVSHWNNKEGGKKLDTSRCFMGQERFNKLLKMLPANQTVVGIDEHTSIVLDFEQGCCHILGKDTVTILCDQQTQVFSSGSSFPLSELGEWYIPDCFPGIPQSVWDRAMLSEVERESEPLASSEPPDDVVSLVEARAEARSRKDWTIADSLRDQVAELGWKIEDTPDGDELTPLEDD